MRQIYIAMLLTLLIFLGQTTYANEEKSVYNSCEDTTSHNRWVLHNDTAYWIERKADWGDENVRSYIYKAPIHELNEAACVYGPVPYEISDLMHGEDHLLFVQRKKKAVLSALNYNDDSIREMTKFHGEAHAFLLAEGNLYYIVENKLLQYHMKTHESDCLLVSNTPIGSDLEYAYGRLYLTMMDYENPESNHCGIYSLDITTGQTLHLTHGEPYPYTIIGDQLYTYSGADGTIRMGLNGEHIEAISERMYRFSQAGNNCVIASYSDAMYNYMMLYALADDALFNPDSENRWPIHSGVGFMLGEYLVDIRETEDDGGSLTQEYVAKSMNELILEG